MVVLFYLWYLQDFQVQSPASPCCILVPGALRPTSSSPHASYHVFRISFYNIPFYFVNKISCFLQIQEEHNQQNCLLQDISVLKVSTVRQQWYAWTEKRCSSSLLCLSLQPVPSILTQLNEFIIWRKSNIILICLNFFILHYLFNILLRRGTRPNCFGYVTRSRKLRWGITNGMRMLVRWNGR